MTLHIISYGALTPAQIKTLEAFESVLLEPPPKPPDAIATFTTFQGQRVKAVIDRDGVILAVKLEDA